MNPDYHSYLVRIWRPDPDSPWRILVESIASRERHGIRDWNELMAFLQQDVNPEPAAKDTNWSNAAAKTSSAGTRSNPMNGSDSVTRNSGSSMNSSAARKAGWNANDAASPPAPPAAKDGSQE